MIEIALERFRGNRRAAAEALGISERTLYRKLNEATAAERAVAEPAGTEPAVPMDDAGAGEMAA